MLPESVLFPRNQKEIEQMLPVLYPVKLPRFHQLRENIVHREQHYLILQNLLFIHQRYPKARQQHPLSRRNLYCLFVRPHAASFHHRQQIAALYVLRLGCHVLVHHILLADQLEIGVLYQLVLVSLSSVSP